MGSVNFITHADVLQLIAKRTAEDCIIFLSGPTSRKTPLSLLRMKDVIAVNGSVQYLLNNNAKPFLYLLTDVRFLHRRREDFYNFSRNSQFTIVNLDVYEQASVDDQKYIEENCLIIRSFYRREKGGFLKKRKLNLISSSGFIKHYLFQFLFRKEDDWLDFARISASAIALAILLLIPLFRLPIPSSMAVLYVLGLT